MKNITIAVVVGVVSLLAVPASSMASLLVDDFSVLQSFGDPPEVLNPLGDFDVSAVRTFSVFNNLGPATMGTGFSSSGSTFGSQLVWNPVKDLGAAVIWDNFDGTSAALAPDVFASPLPAFVELAGVTWSGGSGNPDLTLFFEVFQDSAVTPALTGSVLLINGATNNASFTVPLVGTIAADETVSLRLSTDVRPSGGGTLYIGSVSVGVVPEPSSFLLAGIGLAVLGGARYRRRKLVVLNS